MYFTMARVVAWSGLRLPSPIIIWSLESGPSRSNNTKSFSICIINCGLARNIGCLTEGISIPDRHTQEKRVLSCCSRALLRNNALLEPGYDLPRWQECRQQARAWNWDYSFCHRRAGERAQRTSSQMPFCGANSVRVFNCIASVSASRGIWDFAGRRARKVIPLFARGVKEF